MRVFLVAGKSGTGKDEVATIIKEYYQSNGKKTVITKLSKYIRLFASEMLGWDGNEDSKPRRFLQGLGIVLRNEKPRFLIDRMLDDLHIYEKYFENVIICDVRLIDEIDIFKKEVNNVITIHMISDGSKNKLTENEKNHITETELDNYNNFDYEIVNNYNDDLKKEVIKILEGLK